MQRLILPAVLLTLSACGKPGNYPSLNPRPIEAKAAGLLTEPAPQSPAVQPATGAVIAKIDAALASAKRGDAAFRSSSANAQSAARIAGASGSESWITAQMAVSNLESARAPVKAALSDLDGLLRTTLAGPPSEDLPGLKRRSASLKRLMSNMLKRWTRC